MRVSTQKQADEKSQHEKLLANKQEDIRALQGKISQLNRRIKELEKSLEESKKKRNQVN